MAKKPAPEKARKAAREIRAIAKKRNVTEREMDDVVKTAVRLNTGREFDPVHNDVFKVIKQFMWSHMTPGDRQDLAHGINNERRRL